jgi:hypothetical protein
MSKGKPDPSVNRVGIRIVEKVRTCAVKGAAFDRLDDAGIPRFKSVQTTVRSTQH